MGLCCCPAYNGTDHVDWGLRMRVSAVLMERRCPLPSSPCSAGELRTGHIYRRHHTLCCLSARLHVVGRHRKPDVCGECETHCPESGKRRIIITTVIIIIIIIIFIRISVIIMP